MAGLAMGQHSSRFLGNCRKYDSHPGDPQRNVKKGWLPNAFGVLCKWYVKFGTAVCGPACTVV